jgi:hypothetical protein
MTYIQNKINSSTNKNHTYWQIIKILQNKEGNKNKKLPEIENIDQINNFNKHFANTYKIFENNKEENTQKQDIKQQINQNSFYLTPFTSKEIETTIQKIKTNTMPGTDNIHPKHIKDAKEVIIPELCKLYNKIIDTQKIPDKMKETIIIPIYKSGDKNKYENYRPIAIANTITKIFENILHKKIYQFVEKTKIISENQYGFRAKHSTLDCLENITNYIHEAIDDKLECAAIIMDLQKAFELVNRATLLKKLENMGFRGQTQNLLQNYFENRKQLTKCNQTLSELTKIDQGIPQGSCLGPLFFILYINDIHQIKREINTEIYCYADDTTILFKSDNNQNLEKEINKTLEEVKNWADINNITINNKKTTYMKFQNNRNKKEKKDKDHKIKIKINKNEIREVQDYKILGINIDNKLTYHKHVEQNINQIIPLIKILNKSKNQINNIMKKMIYKNLLIPKICYGDIIWGNNNSKNTKNLDRINKYATKIFYNGKKTNTNKTCKANNILKITDYYKIKMNLNTIKKLRDNTRSHKIKEQQSNRKNSINNTMLRVIRRKSEFGKKHILNKRIKEYNEIPKFIKNINNLNEIKNKLEEKYIEEY